MTVTIHRAVFDAMANPSPDNPFQKDEGRYFLRFDEIFVGPGNKVTYSYLGKEVYYHYPKGLHAVRERVRIPISNGRTEVVPT